MRGVRAFLAAGLALHAAGAVAAASGNQIPSCYAFSRIGLAPPPPSREVFVLVDQTTPFDRVLKAAIRDSVGPLLVPGSAFVVASFSAFAQGRYETPLAVGALERPVDKRARDDLSVRALTALDRCLARQIGFGRKLAEDAIDRAVAGQSDTLAHSDIVGSLEDFAKRVAASPARDRIVIVASDMLENSGVANFYARRTIRRIDAARELKAVARQGFLGDFGGARVYVIGAGVLGGGPDAYRDPASMKALELFWDGWFRSSHATLADFGKPMPTRPIR